MMAMGRTRISVVTVVLAVCNLGLVSALGIQLWKGSERSSLLMVAPAQIQVSEQEFGVPIGQDSGDDLQALALFHASRSFYIPPAPAMRVRPPPDYRLAGVIRLPSRPVAAVVISNQTNARMKISKGDRLDEWSVEDIQPGKIEISLDGQRAEITTKSSAAVTANAAVSDRISGLTIVPKGQAAPAPSSVLPVSQTRVLSAPGTQITSPVSQSDGSDPGGRLFRPPSR
jgi:hypothetical protein